MIVANDSPLRTVPSSLSRGHVLLLDGIRYSIDMADLAYGRLVQVLVFLSKTHDPKREVCSTAFQDAWTIVDSLERLRKLIPHVPVKKSDPAYELFLRSASAAHKLRNAVQHMDNDLRDPERLKAPMWGTLSWVTAPDWEKKFAKVFLLVSGSIFEVKDHHFVNPVGQVVDRPIGLITLALGEEQISLTEQLGKLVKVTRSIEQLLSERYKEDPRGGADVLQSVECWFDGSQDGVPVAVGDKLSIGVSIRSKESSAL